MDFSFIARIDGLFLPLNPPPPCIQFDKPENMENNPFLTKTQERAEFHEI